MTLSPRFFLTTTAIISVSVAGLLYAETPKPSLAAALQPFVDKNELAGAVVLVADKDKVLATETVGKADIAAGKAMQKDSLFWIASMSKPITGTAFMILVDEGKVKMDDPVSKYLPEFKDQMVIVEKDEEHVLLKKLKQPVLLRHLLSHTSGLDFRSPVETPTLDKLLLDTAVRSYASQPLLHEPDSKYLYSNEGINTAGRIIEVVTGMKFEDFLQQRIFDPLGMKETTFWPTEEQLKRLVTPYKPNATKDGLEATTIAQLHYPLSDKVGRFPMPGGGLFSTAQDVASFCQMILSGGTINGKRIISEESIKLMTSNQTAPETKSSYGFGWATDGKGVFGHGGALSTDMSINSINGLITIYLVQHAGFPGEGKTAGGVFKNTALKLFKGIEKP